MNVRDLMRQRLLADRAKEALPQHFYSGPADFLLRHGEFFRVHRVKRGIPRHCYANAIAYAWGLSWQVVEGYAMRPLPNRKYLLDGDPDEIFAHAWVRDPANGRCYEVTWPEPGRVYFGVPFSAVREDDATWNGDACILFDKERGYPLFRRPWDGETWWTTDDPAALERLVATTLTTTLVT